MSVAGSKVFAVAEGVDTFITEIVIEGITDWWLIDNVYYKYGYKRSPLFPLTFFPPRPFSLLLVRFTNLPICRFAYLHVSQSTSLPACQFTSFPIQQFTVY